MTPALLPRCATRLLQLFGWKVVYVAPRVPKAVIVLYPHTSNWDFVIGILARSAIALPVRFAGKDSLFRWPFGALFRWLGGIPVNRRESTGFVGQLAAEFARHQRFYLAIAPEGTRRATASLKSGFYRLALAAQVPLGLAFVDYPRRAVGIVDYLVLSGDPATDLARIAAAYAGCRGKYPDQHGRIAFGASGLSGDEAANAEEINARI